MVPIIIRTDFRIPEPYRTVFLYLIFISVIISTFNMIKKLFTRE